MSEPNDKKMPDEIMAWFGQWPLDWAGTWATTRYPEDAVAYVRADELDRIKKAGQELAAENDNLREALVFLSTHAREIRDQNPEKGWHWIRFSCAITKAFNALAGTEGGD